MCLSLPLTVVLAATTANACLYIVGIFNSDCSIQHGWINIYDNGVMRCSGDFTNENDCTLNCIGGYSARVTKLYGELTYSTPHGEYT